MTFSRTPPQRSMTVADATLSSSQVRSALWIPRHATRRRDCRRIDAPDQMSSHLAYQERRRLWAGSQAHAAPGLVEPLEVLPPGRAALAFEEKVKPLRLKFTVPCSCLRH